MKTNFFTCWFLLLISSLHAHAGFMDNWVTKQVSTNFGLTHVTYGKGRFVAYGLYSDYGALMSSEDGINWPLRLDGRNGSGFSYSVALSFAGGKFFALGGFGISAWSSDGITWTTLYFPNCVGVAHNGTRYVAAINDIYTFPPTNSVLTSSDGVAWTPVPSFEASLGDIVYGNGLFVALGVYNGVTNNGGHDYTSTTGTTWTERSVPTGGKVLSFCNGLFIVPVAPGVNAISSNGMEWDSVNTGLTLRLGKVIYAHGTFVALAGGADGCDCNFTSLATSTNGTNWFQYSKAFPRPANAFATDGNRVVAVSSEYVGPYLNGFIQYLDPNPSLQISNSTQNQLFVSGWVGRSHRIESTDSITNPSPTWQARTNFVLPSDNFPWTDPTASASTQRFYRAVLLQ